MHHSSDNIPPSSALLKTLYGSQVDEMKKRLGATGEFPAGKLVPSDEGEIGFSVGCADGKVVINFNTQVCWIGMTPEQAIDLANGLKKHARKAQKLEQNK